MIFKTALVLAISLVGIGLIFNGINTVNATGNAPIESVSNSVTTNSASISGASFSPAPIIPAPISPAPLSDEHELLIPITYESVLVKLHTGQWFGWSDPHNKVYANLIIHDNQYSKPTKAFLDAELIILENTDTIKRNTRNTLRGNRINLETRFLNDTYSNADVVQYLRLLGNF